MVVEHDSTKNNEEEYIIDPKGNIDNKNDEVENGKNSKKYILSYGGVSIRK